MRVHPRQSLLLIMTLALAALSGCMSGPVGEASLTVAALSAVDVDRVEVTITGPDISLPIVQELSRASATPSPSRGPRRRAFHGTEPVSLVQTDSSVVAIARGLALGSVTCF